MKEAIYNKRGTKQLINSGWKLFDKQTNCISTGNCYCNTQMSSFIRPYNETMCNGFIREKGHLMNWDLQQYSSFHIPANLDKIIRDKERQESVILYMFFTSDKLRGINPFCWVLTDRNHKLLGWRLVVRYKEQFIKRADAFSALIGYITD